MQQNGDTIAEQTQLIQTLMEANGCSEQLEHKLRTSEAEHTKLQEQLSQARAESELLQTDLSENQVAAAAERTDWTMQVCCVCCAVQPVIV